MNKPFNSSANFNEWLQIGNRKPICTNTSGRFLGKVDITGYDALSKEIFTDSYTNDLTVPGARESLSGMFGIDLSSTDAFLIKTAGTSFPISASSTSGYSEDTAGAGETTGNRKIFGFMMGIGGEDSGTVIAPSYKSRFLNNGTLSSMSFVPFKNVDSATSRIHTVDSGETTEKKYSVRGTVTSTGGTPITTTYYYVKGFKTTPTLHTVDTSTETAITNSNINTTTSPIVNYVDMQMEMLGSEVQTYFTSNPSEAYINQLGLVAGVPILSSGTVVGYKDVALITCLNVKSYSFSDANNVVNITYRLYCV